ncbi:polysaccharide deacetylase family protein [Arthrobacter sp.]|uniref:polysaccharide deacetylase family protein n=1 Tax=Arthrobacter sp. TaxID=1667 RepID=UPI003395E407
MRTTTGNERRRAFSLVAALSVLLLAIALAVLITARPGSAPSSSPSGASMSPSPNSPAVTPSHSPAPPPSFPTETETPEAGQTPVQPTATLPPVPFPEPPESTAPPPTDPFPSSLRGQDLTVLPGGAHVVALTFDAGANAAGLPKILSALADKGVPGTFFLTGNWAETNPGGVRQIVAAGHRVANHSMTHPGFTGLPDQLIAQQVLGAEQAILDAGADPAPYFRFPYGERDARTIAAINNLGYVAVRWTVDTLGWKGTSGGISTQTVTERVLAGLQPGEIVLMHMGSNPDDGSTLDADALPGIIERIRAQGYGFVILDALLGG